MQIVGHLNALGRDEVDTNILFQEPQLISGIGDFCQVHVSYTTEPQSNTVVFKFKIANMTTFQI